jgi:sialate O-acetylesterase
MKKLCILLICLTTCFTSLVAAVRLPKIFSRNMVLQRDIPIKIWGWTEKNATVSVVFNGQVTKAKANANGMWLATLKPMKHGGPLEMKISDRSGAILLTNILIGDVGLGVGQSNMEWIVKNSNHSKGRNCSQQL